MSALAPVVPVMDEIYLMSKSAVVLTYDIAKQGLATFTMNFPFSPAFQRRAQARRAAATDEYLNAYGAVLGTPPPYSDFNFFRLVRDAQDPMTRTTKEVSGP